MTTTEQPTLFPTGPTARTTDPPTSLAAGQSLSTEALSVMQEWVMCAHLEHLGLTDEQMCELLPDFHPPSLIKRRGELAKAGLVVDSGRTRFTKRWRDAIVWKRTEEAERQAGLRS